MKRILLIMVLGFAVLQLANAQVIELIGQGVVGVNPSTLLIPDNGPVEKVVVVAAALFYGTVPANPQDITFSDANETHSVSFMETDPTILLPYLANDPNLAFGYYTATFNTVDVGGIILNSHGQEKYIISYTAYVYRSGDAPGVFSDVKGPHACLYRNGKDSPMEYSVTIPASVSPRDVVVTLPFSHLYDHTGRPANVKITAGDKMIESEFSTNNRGNYLRLETLTLEDVGGDVTEVVVSIFSQKVDELLVGVSGANFITGPGLVTTTFALDVPDTQVCTLPKGYWKTHSEYGPAPYDALWANLPQGGDTEFFHSWKSYYEVLWTPPAGGNSYYILAHQYIAAELNILAGASGDAVSAEMTAAKALLETYTPAQVLAMKGNDEVKKSFTSLAGKLGEYNDGEIGPGHCDYEEMEQENNAVTLQSKVNPNPVKNNARIEFVPVVDGNATVELFDSMGNKKATLFNQNVQKDILVSLGLNVRGYIDGAYIIVIMNGAVKESHMISIGR